MGLCTTVGLGMGSASPSLGACGVLTHDSLFGDSTAAPIANKIVKKKVNDTEEYEGGKS